MIERTACGSAGVTIELPSGWHTTAPNDGNVTDPVTRLVVASGPIRPDPRACQVSDYIQIESRP